MQKRLNALKDVCESLSYLTYDSSLKQNEILIQAKVDIERVRKTIEKGMQAMQKELNSQKD